jgi:VWFA-related protein
MRRIPLFIFLGLSLIGFSKPLTPGQERRQEKAQDRLQHEVSVIRKLIYVIVTDREGKPITDLRKDEFKLFDNGKEMTITEYENHTLSLPGEERQPRPAAATPLEKAPPPAAPLMSRSFFFLFDLVFTDPGGLRLARKAALRFLETDLEPNDQIAVLSFGGGRSLKVHHLPDQDREAARRAIESIGLGSLMPIAPIRPALVSQVRISVSRTADAAFSSRGVDAGGGGSGVGRIVAGNFIWALDSLAQALRYSPGRKVIVLYSNGLDPSYLGRGQFLQSGNSDLGRAYQDVCHKLAAASASVFAVDTEENAYFHIPESEKGAMALREIASETGGRFIGTTYAAPDHMEKIDTMTGAYYVLGYPIVESWDGRYHKVKVKVTRPGCEVNAQPGYFSDKPFPEYSDLEKRIHLVDLALSEKPLSQEPVRFTMQALPWASAPPDDIRFVAEIPVGRLDDVIGPRLEAVSLVFNGLDELVDTRRVELDLTQSDLREKSVFFQADLSAEPGNYKCRLVLRNTETGRGAVAAASTVVPEPDLNVIMLFPPLFLISREPSVYLSGGSAKNQRTKDQARDAGAGLARGFPVEAEKYAPLFEETLLGGSEIYAITRCTGKSAADSTLSASLRNPATGEVFPVLLVIKAERAEKVGRSLLLLLSLPRIPPGAYHLVISAEVEGIASKVAKKIQIE